MVILIVIGVIIAFIVLAKKGEEASRIKNGVPEGFKFLRYKAGSLELRPGKVCAWAEDEKLKFSDINGLKQAEIPIEKIIKVDYDSNVQTVTTGGGRSISGAAIGGLALGPVGAVVGGRSKSETRKVDMSTVQLIFTGQNGIEQSLIFDGVDYSDLAKLVST